MPNAYQTTIDEFEKKFLDLLTNYQQLKSDNEALKADLETCRKELFAAKKMAAEYRDNYEVLKVARAFGQSEQDKKNAYRRITTLMRDIDTCLALLNE
ncbi:MAG: hypothetical protein LBS16_05565 [Prevotellaceae bacterium]|jgi:chromosome segregation ATPase|nr:hypothetical protein [Prevotellaceae bacterium]